jgi:hypothetical protein
VARAIPTSMAAHATGRMSAGGVDHVEGGLRLTAETKCTVAAVQSNTTAAAGGRSTLGVSVRCNVLQLVQGLILSYDLCIGRCMLVHILTRTCVCLD